MRNLPFSSWRALVSILILLIGVVPCDFIRLVLDTDSLLVNQVIRKLACGALSADEDDRHHVA